MPRCRLILLAAGVLLAAAAAPAAFAAEAPAKAEAGDVVVKTLPGIEVDTRAREVRLGSEVVLQTGALELFVCSEGTREHESVLAVRARPSHVTFALSLLGLDPGKPGVTTEAGAFSPPAGRVLAITCRYTGPDGTPREVPAYRFLRLAGSETPLDRRLDWVYVGRPEADALRAADREGTVVCLSNFPEAVIDVPFESTADNAALVYEANPEAVPKVGTPVEIVIRPTGRRIEPKKVQAEVVLEKGRPPRLDGKAMDLETLAATVSRLPARIRTTVLRVDPDERFGRVMKVHEALRNALMHVHMTIYEPEAEGTEKAPALRVRLDAQGRVTVGGKTMAAADFRKQVATLLGEATRVDLRADAGASYSTVAEILAAVRDAGASVTLSREGDGTK
ncbi:MAG: YdjY domain-containing protein [Phycisphaerae bacterium]